MYDGVTPAHLPTDGDIYAGYVNGLYSNMATMKALHPGKLYIGITIDPSVPAQVYDCEPGNGSASDGVNWVNISRAAGYVPTIYCGLNTWYPAISQAIRNAGVAQPGYWIADGTKWQIPTLPLGVAYALQDQLDVPPGFDRSIVADYWPTIDGLTPQGGGTPITPPAVIPEDEMFRTIRCPERNANVYAYNFSGLGWRWIANPDIWNSVKAMPGFEGHDDVTGDRMDIAADWAQSTATKPSNNQPH